MPIWNDDYLNYLLNNAEIEFSQKVPSIFTRFSLATTSGVSTYNISANKLIGIHRVTWKGEKLDSFEHASGMQRSDWIRPQNQGTTSKPLFYLSYEYGYGFIKFHPIPNETIAADDTNIYGSDIANRVIISGYRLADPTAETYRIPEYLRRRFTKYHAMERAYRREGPGQDIRAANYFGKKHDFVVGLLQDIITKIPKAVAIRLGDVKVRQSRKPARPVLPSDGPWSF